MYMPFLNKMWDESPSYVTARLLGGFKVCLPIYQLFSEIDNVYVSLTLVPLGLLFMHTADYFGIRHSMFLLFVY